MDRQAGKDDGGGPRKDGENASINSVFDNDGGTLDHTGGHHDGDEHFVACGQAANLIDNGLRDDNDHHVGLIAGQQEKTKVDRCSHCHYRPHYRLKRFRNFNLC